VATVPGILCSQAEDIADAIAKLDGRIPPEAAAPHPFPSTI
jgi:hypothetical protein